jgi:hypothetical protein
MTPCTTKYGALQQQQQQQPTSHTAVTHVDYADEVVFAERIDDGRNRVFHQRQRLPMAASTPAANREKRHYFRSSAGDSHGNLRLLPPPSARPPNREALLRRVVGRQRFTREVGHVIGIGCHVAETSSVGKFQMPRIK